MPLKTIVLDDHAVDRRGIVQILLGHPDIALVGNAGDYGQLRALMRSLGEINLLVIDVNVPGNDGIEILKELLAEIPRLKVLVVSKFAGEQYAVRALRAGAAGYINKADAPERLLDAVQQIAAGRKYVTPEIVQALIENLKEPEHVAAHERLSDRELQVLKLIAMGQRLTDIADALALSRRTVSVYRARILERIGKANNEKRITFKCSGLVRRR